jgi:hypothetical protein
MWQWASAAPSPWAVGRSDGWRRPVTHFGAVDALDELGPVCRLFGEARHVLQILELFDPLHLLLQFPKAKRAHAHTRTLRHRPAREADPFGVGPHRVCAAERGRATLIAIIGTLISIIGTLIAIIGIDLQLQLVALLILVDLDRALVLCKVRLPRLREPSCGGDVAGLSPVAVQMWQSL